MWAPERHAHHPVTSPVGPCFLISNVVATITALGMLLCPWAIPRGPSPAPLPFTPPAWNDRHVSMGSSEWSTAGVHHKIPGTCKPGWSP